jgi:hypothetical protein
MNGLITAAVVRLKAALAASTGAGLVGWMQSGVGAILRAIGVKLQEHPSGQDYGVKGDNATDDAANMQKAADARTLVEFPEGTYRASGFAAKAGRTFRALGQVVVNLFYAGDERLVRMLSDSYYEGFKFVSLEADRNSQRIAIDDASNIHAVRCGAFNFKNPTNGNGWGVLIQRSKNITLENWTFGGNTQSDIAITDSCENIVIVNPSNTVDGGVGLNLEPNAGSGVTGLTVNGGKYRFVTLLENENTSYASKGVVIQGASIDLLKYDGAGVNIIGTTIKALEPESQLVGFAGPFRCDSIDLGPNLLTDPYLFDVSPYDAACFWTAYEPNGVTKKRMKTALDGCFTRLNHAGANTQIIISTRANIPVTAGESLLTFMRARAFYSGTGTANVDHLIVRWFNAANAQVGESIIKTNRAPVNTDTEWNNDVAVLKVPATATQAMFRITTSYTANTTAMLDVQAVGLFRPSLLPNARGGGNMNAILDALSRPVVNPTYYLDHVPAGSQSYPGGVVGDYVERMPPVAGQPKGWKCTAAPGVVGDAGTWVSVGAL